MAINEFQKYPSDKKKFDENYERVFGKRCFIHGAYDGEHKPIGDCKGCWEFYNEKRNKETT